MELHGSCLCGSINFVCEGKPLMMGCCHCADCQKASGSAFSPLLIYPKDKFRLLRGNPKEFCQKGGSGKEVKRSFCSNCGSLLTTWYEVTPDFMVIMAGCIDNKAEFTPAWDIYTKEAQSWVEFGKGHKVYPMGYGSK